MGNRDWIVVPDDANYGVVYGDPPWHFGSKQLQKYGGSRFASLDGHEYPTMKTDEICALPVQDIVADDAALFLWVTDGHLEDGMRVISAWGFKYVTIAFIWSKKTTTGKQVATLGAWTMKNCEVCLLGIRGRMLKYKVSNREYQQVDALRTNHSRKPDEVRSRIQRIFPSLPKIELFAREKVDNWDVWGNEVDSDILILNRKEVS